MQVAGVYAPNLTVKVVKRQEQSSNDVFKEQSFPTTTTTVSFFCCSNTWPLSHLPGTYEVLLDGFRIALPVWLQQGKTLRSGSNTGTAKVTTALFLLWALNPNTTQFLCIHCLMNWELCQTFVTSWERQGCLDRSESVRLMLAATAGHLEKFIWWRTSRLGLGFPSSGRRHGGGPLVWAEQLLYSLFLQNSKSARYFISQICMLTFQFDIKAIPVRDGGRIFQQTMLGDWTTLPTVVRNCNPLPNALQMDFIAE